MASNEPNIPPISHLVLLYYFTLEYYTLAYYFISHESDFNCTKSFLHLNMPITLLFRVANEKENYEKQPLEFLPKQRRFSPLLNFRTYSGIIYKYYASYGVSGLLKL